MIPLLAIVAGGWLWPMAAHGQMVPPQVLLQPGDDPTGAWCATEDIARDLSATVDHLLANAPQGLGGNGPNAPGEPVFPAMSLPTSGSLSKKIEIPIAFTIFYDSQFPVEWYEALRQTWSERQRQQVPDVTDGRLVTFESVRITMERLNELYAPHGIMFKLYDGVPDPVRWVDDWMLFYDWFGLWKTDMMAYRQAEIAWYGIDYPNVLNIFLHMNVPGPFLGLGSFPSDVSDPARPWAIDIDFRTMPGVSTLVRPDLDPGPNSRDYSSLTGVVYPGELNWTGYSALLPHEVGHCVGLFHTFTNSTPGFLGDMVDDTPMEALPFKGDGIIRTPEFADFPVDRNTTDDSWYWRGGKDPSDPVRNVMDYGHFHYRQVELTRGQARNVHLQIARYLPQFVVQAKAEKDARERLLVWADFERDGLADRQVTNKADRGGFLPLYVRKDGTGTAALVSGGIDLRGDAALHVSEDDLSRTPDASLTSHGGTIAFRIALDPAAGFPVIDGLPFAAGFQVAAHDFYAPPLYLDFVPYLPWDLGTAYVRLQVGDAQRGLHVEYMAIPSAWLFDGPMHIALVLDEDAGVTWYLNGMAAGPLAAYGPTAPWASFDLGRTYLYSVDGSQTLVGLNGRIDDLAIYNVALDEPQVLSLMAYGPEPQRLDAQYRPKAK